MSCSEWRETELGLIPAEWEYSELKDKVEVIMGQSPKSEYYNSNQQGMPFLQGRKTFGEKFPQIDTWCINPIKVAQKGDVLLSVRAPVGDLNISNQNICIGRGLASLRMKNGNNEFLYYLLKNYRSFLLNKQNGTVFGSINKNDIENLKLPFPPLDEQKAIAKILSDIDEKIEINNRIIKVLEEIAQTIYKRWFVDFEFPNENGEPYKSSGGEMVQSELGPIPKGWEIVRLGEYISFVKGKKPKNIIENKKDGYVEYLTIDVLNNNSRLFADPEKMITVENKNNMMVMDGASSGTIYFGFKGIVASTLAKIEVINNKLNDDILYFILKYYENDIKNHTTGSAIPHVDKEYIRRLSIALPQNNELINEYSILSKNIRNQIYIIIMENQRLSQLRDTLLPKLMSGEIRVELNNGQIVLKNNEDQNINS